MLIINDSAVTTEIAALHEEYEAALVSNDVEKLTNFFWDSPLALRFGVAESLYGSSEIEAFRKTRSPIGLDREVFNLRLWLLVANAPQSHWSSSLGKRNSSTRAPKPSLDEASRRLEDSECACFVYSSVVHRLRCRLNRVADSSGVPRRSAAKYRTRRAYRRSATWFLDVGTD